MMEILPRGTEEESSAKSGLGREYVEEGCVFDSLAGADYWPCCLVVVGVAVQKRSDEFADMKTRIRPCRSDYSNANLTSKSESVGNREEGAHKSLWNIVDLVVFVVSRMIGCRKALVKV
jgi:hypothetical protein